jgi:hypothetical protein
MITRFPKPKADPYERSVGKVNFGRTEGIPGKMSERREEC